jgi:poly-gamma-glutamate capsule biosynthesis protein CapA/YwtB (metallophosphatase superfamily)
MRGLVALVLVAALVPACADAGTTALQARATLPARMTTAVTGRPVSSAPARGRLVIHGVGDVNLDPDYIPALRAKGYAHAWTGLSGLFVGDDLSIVNLECAVSTLGTKVEKQFNFRCDPAALPAMRAAGVEVANLANNHGNDYGPQALLDSRANLLRAGIAPVGVGENAAAANTPALFTRNGWTIAVLGFSGVVPTNDWLARPAHPGMANGYDITNMTKAIRAAGQLADLVFVTIHWGRELATQPRPEDVARAHAMIDAGADGIFGHHAHRLQPLSWYRGRPIAWGLGNFVWPNLSTDASRTAVAEFVVQPDGSIKACLLPAVINSPGHPVLTQPYEGPCA